MDIIENRVSINEWNNFIEHRRDSTIYHTPEWKQFIENTLHAEPKYLFGKEDDEIVSLLPLFKVKSVITGNRLSSLPFSHVCGPIGSSQGITALLDHAQKSVDGSRYGLEIKGFSGISGYHINEEYCTYVLNIGSPVENVWKGLDRGSVRWAINKSKNSGVSVDVSCDGEAIKDFYELNCRTKRDLGVPGHPLTYIQNLFKYLGPKVSLYSARIGNQMIGGGIMERYNLNVIYGYGAADPEHINCHPYHAFIWESIKDAINNECQTYDFGRASKDNIGLIRFKKKWGAIEKQLFYNQYPEAIGSRLTSRDSSLVNLGSSIVRKMPMPLFKGFSKLTFSHFG